ncbi:MAG TPA: ABC transporter permease [Candidatus Limnocylindrales bacterium]|jgi:peptide/nickel transport system permease protein
MTQLLASLPGDDHDVGVTATGAALVETSGAEEQISVASQWRLMWWRFRKHKLALLGAIVVALFYVAALGADFFAYSNPYDSGSVRANVPPQPIYFFDNGEFGPFVYGLKRERDTATLKLIYTADPSVKIPLQFFAKGFEYDFLGIFPADVHIIGPVDGAAEETIYLLGTDIQGRDLWSRIMFGTRTSLTIGLAGVLLSLVLGVVLGGISGFFGGWVDTLIQRLIEIIRSVPVIPLWLGLTAAMPKDWDILLVYFFITIIISFIGWTELGRVVRGRFLALRHEDFVAAAELAGSSTRRIIFVHMLPLLTSHIIAATTLALPVMIISETSLSFLGLGLRIPAISWGTLLHDAQNVQALAITPWLLIVAIPVIVAILAFNLFGDGLRDAADPYA